MRVHVLGLNAKQLERVRRLDADGWAVTYLRTQVGGDPEFHLYAGGRNHRITINDDGVETWLTPAPTGARAASG